MATQVRLAVLAVAFALLQPALIHLQPVHAQDGKIVPYVPTPQEVVDRMLELAQVKKGDVVYDLGSGDGRIVVTAAKKYGVKAIGFEIDHGRVVRDPRAKLVAWGVVGMMVALRFFTFEPSAGGRKDQLETISAGD